MKDTSGAESIK